MAKQKLGDMIDALYDLRAHRLEKQRAYEKIIEDMKVVETQMEDLILKSFDKNEIEGAKGMSASASVSRLVVPSVKNWPDVFRYIADHDAWDLLEKRMARVAYRDRTEAGEAIPGTEPFVKIGLNLTRINKE